MPAFLIPAIVGALLTVAQSLVARILVAIGVGAVTYSGLNAGLTYFQTTFSSAMGGTGAIVAGMCGVLRLDVILGIYTAAALARLAIAGATSGTLKRMVLK